jgi:NADP-dependent aldehyde dehydrogenase
LDGAPSFRAHDPVRDTELDPGYADASPSEIDRALSLAAEAAEAMKTIDRGQLASFLDACGDAILDLGDSLLERGEAETALPRARLTGERGRTVGQLKMFAGTVRDGAHLDARIDHAIPDRAPLPKPDLRRMLRPIGPTVVFGASNFPLAFSVAGGDTASALAAGCPVVVKGHPYHPGTSEAVGEAVAAAAAATRMPEGVFSLLHGARHDVGGALVRHPLTRAVGFTGSLRAGRALFDIANQRDHPIPVFAEMGSVNPVFVFADAAKTRGSELAAGLAGSVLLGVGQFCTNPGLTFVPVGDEGDAFVEELRAGLAGCDAGTMLHPNIRTGYEGARSRLDAAGGGTGAVVGTGAGTPEPPRVSGGLYVTDAATFLARPELHEEVFGPATLVVRWTSGKELEEIVRSLDGQLTASVFATDRDLGAHANVLSPLEDRVGRLIFNGYPTGVEVCPSMNHGGPYPATTDVRTTSVGTAAIQRFLRPVCFQDVPDALLPPELQAANPTRVRRLVDGEWA